MIPQNLLKLVLELAKLGAGFKPHRLLTLLTVIQLSKEKKLVSPIVYYNDDFRAIFTDLFSQYADSSDSNRPHNPFFHLRNSGFWKLVPLDGKENELSSTKSIGGPGDLERLVAYAEISSELFNVIKSEESRKELEDIVINCLVGARLNRSRQILNDKSFELYSLFEHEENAINEIRKRIDTHNLGYVLQNLFIHDSQSNIYLETDVVVICRFGLYVIELKHWTGNIQIRPNNWLLNNSFPRKDPHIVNSTKAKLLRGILDRRFPQIADTFVESVVVLTNPDATVEGVSASTTLTHNPTFHGIDRLIDYLRNQQGQKKEVLDKIHAKALSEYLTSLNMPGRPRGLQFPGYELIEYLYQSTDRVEVVARRTDVRYQQLSRLRVFFNPQGGSPEEKRMFHERATATLNAAAKVGDHPNILKVWSVPNDYGYIVEGSDWSQEGTLGDVLDQNNILEAERAVDITRGILSGLHALHEKDVIHRALSPDNILMVEATPRLTNFDLSYQLEDHRQTVIPDPSKLKKSAYIAPEVYRAEPSLSEAADLFSVGVILYEMLTGERPFSCSTDLEKTSGRLSSNARHKLESFPPHLAQLIDDVVCMDAGLRPKSVEAILNILGTKVSKEDIFPNSHLQQGDHDGLYEISKLIQEGVESQLYKACGPKGREVVLKVFNVGVPLPRTLNECEMARAVRHPAIVWVDNHGRWPDGRFYIAFEYVKGSSLRTLIGKEQPSLGQFQRIAGLLLDGLFALHGFIEDGNSNPILHNDIKPENILLAEGHRPVLIDFGIASHPQVGVYSGTKGYVAPDLQVGTDRDYCVGGDLYALGSTLFEWLFGRLPKAEDFNFETSEIWEGIPIGLRNWFEISVAREAEERFRNAKEMKDALVVVQNEQAEIILQQGEAELLEQVSPTEIIAEQVPVALPEIVPAPDKEIKLERIEFTLNADQPPNQFVGYLNSLHCRDASSENALAEFQANNPLFGHIHVPHPLTDSIQSILLDSQKRHVILTGHAGDGKSTIGLELFKRIKGLSLDQPLDDKLNPRESLTIEKTEIVIIKDFSEWKKEERQLLLHEMLRKNGPKFLLISNTGTLLDAFKEYGRQVGDDILEIESNILTKISKEIPEEFLFKGTDFTIINLAMMDTLPLAEQIFEKMVAKDRWNACLDKKCRESCPIYRNVSLIQKNYPVVCNRLFLAFRRMYEYGVRLTIRQITAHLAYMITSGLEYADIVRLSNRAEKPLMSEFMFYNRFFGDNGKDKDLPALQLRSVREVRHQGFGELPCPTWERRLWLQAKGQSFYLKAEACEEDFALLRQLGSRIKYDEGITHGQAREQVRRMLYFLHGFDSDGDSFIKTFLHSAAILDFVRWQSKSSRLMLQEKTLLKRRILHVLQEQFTGVRLPEGAQHDRNLYITLSRRKHEVRQSAQVVLARFDSEKEFELDLEDHGDGLAQNRRVLVLKGHGGIKGTRLDLTLPFLDYVIMRNQGGVGEILQAAFVDRLERFKAQLLKRSDVPHGDDIMLVRLRTNHTFRRQIFAVHDDKLEVTDA